MMELDADSDGSYTITIADEFGCELEVSGTCVSCDFGLADETGTVVPFGIADPCTCNDDQSAKVR